MKRFPLGSLRACLIFLVLLAALPALGLTLYLGLEQRRIAATQVKGEALRLAQLISNSQGQIIESTHQLLYMIAQLPQVRNTDSASSSSLFADLLQQNPQYLNIGAADSEGNIFASAVPLAKPINISDRHYFRQALKTRKFSIGHYQIGRIHGKPAINFGNPVFNAEGEVKAIVYASMDLNWINRLASQTVLPNGSTLTVMDKDGMILARYPDPDKFIGKTIQEAPVGVAILTKREGVEEAPGLDGLPRLFGFASFGSPSGSVYVGIGIPKQIAYAKVYRNTTRNLIWLGVVGALALAAAWFIGGVFIMRPVNRLLDVTNRLGEGDLAARTGLPFGPGEISQLAHAFDQMAESLQHREDERKRAEEALLRSQEKFKELYDSAPVGYFEYDAQGNIVSVNQTELEMLGYAREEMIGQPVWNFIIEEETARHQIFSKLAGTMPPARGLEHTYRRKDGTTFPALVEDRLLRDAKGKIIGIRATIQDITERKRAEEALRESEERYRTILENIEDGYYETDLPGNLTFFNDSLCRLLGYSKDEMMGMGNKQYTDEENRKKLFAAFNEVYRTGKPAKGFDWQVFTKNGRKLFGEVSVSLIKDSRGQPTGFRGIARDVTERKQAEKALRTEKQRLQTLLENAPFGIVMIDREGYYEYINPKFIELFGYDLKEVPDGRQWFRKAYPASAYRQNVISTWMNDSKIFEPGEKIPRVFTVTCKDGTEKIIRFITVQLETGENLMSTEDITLLKRAEKEKAALEEQLRQSQRMEAIGRLAGGIAHDFNNLLTVIRGYSQLSFLELKEDNNLKRNLEEIQKATQRAADLTRQLLAFSRRQIMDMKVLDLNALLKDLDKMLRRVIGEDIELVTLLAEDLGRVKTDPGQIEQVIINLAVNARDAMPDGGKLIIQTQNVKTDEDYVWTHVGVTSGQYVMLSLTDTGCGMAPEVKEHLFEPFFTTKEVGKGTGLGLSTVYGIVKQSGGNIWVYSELGKGTTFKIYFPRVDEPLKEIKERVSDEEIPRGSETILAVEDEEKVLRLAVQILKGQGYTVLEASHGEEAMKVAQEHAGNEIHLLLTDVVMPGMSGRELAKSLGFLLPNIKVLYMSGYTDDAIIHHGVLEKGVNYLQKPFTVDSLARKVREVLDQ